jgi:hypothetical protein
MAVHNVGACSGNAPHDVPQNCCVVRAYVPAHRNPSEAKYKKRFQFRERFLGAASARSAVRNQPDAMPASDLFAGEVENVAVQASYRRPEHVQDVKQGHGPE